MRITVFGATGGTGRELVQQALLAGHGVTAVVRDPARLDLDDPRLDVFQAQLGDLSHAELLVPALSGRDAVLSALGGTPPIAERGTATIVRAMELAGVRRLVLVSAAPVVPVPDGESWFFRNAVNPLVRAAFRKNYVDLAAMEREVRASDTDWTVVRPPRLLDKPLSGRYRRELGGNVVGSHDIARADLAYAMLEFVGDEATVRQGVGVAAA